MKNHRIIFVFLDGFGLGVADSSNPFFEASMPFVRGLCGGALVRDVETTGPSLLVKGIDANLGVPGIPQSATGQTALFTGVNAAQLLGYHYPAFPNQDLIAVINEHSLYKKLVTAHKIVTFANGYSPQYFDLVAQGKRTHSVTTRNLMAANIPFRTIQDVRDDTALCFDITNRVVRVRGIDVQERTPARAGEILANLSLTHDLTVFECFLPDMVGHKRSMPQAQELLAVIDAFLAGIVTVMSHDATLVVTSDHGNIEDLSTYAHTVNAVPLIAVGPAASLFAEVKDITMVAGGIFRAIVGEGDA